MSMRFDTSEEDYIYQNSSTFSVPTTGTICLWLLRATTGSIQTFFYIDKTFQIEFHSDDVVKTTLYRQGAKSTESSGTIASTTAWHHVACYYNSSGLNGIVIDGVFDTSDSQTVDTPPDDRFYFGRTKLGTEEFFGAIEDARIYDRILPIEEIANIYHSRGHDGIINGLLRRYLLDEFVSGSLPTQNSMKDRTATERLLFSNNPHYEISTLTPRRMV